MEKKFMKINGRRYRDYSGIKFNHLTFISFISHEGKDRTYWLCRCDCGNELKVNSKSVTDNHMKDCGCMKHERVMTGAYTRLHNKKPGVNEFESKTRLYHIWIGLRSRCYNKNNKDYIRYGGKGITVCNEWLNDFEVFKEWSMNNGYSEELSIDRINVNGNYEPENCRWVTNKIQANNKTNNKFVTYNSETHTVSEWADILHINRRVLAERLRDWQSVEKAFTTPLRVRRKRLS